MPEGIEGVSRILAVSSGKGGVGKTTVTVNLALALAAGGARVGVFDADVHGPNVPRLLGVSGLDPSQSSALTMTLGRREDGSYIPPLERHGLKIMSVGLLLADTDTVTLNARSMGLLVTRTLCDTLWGELDYLLVDLPPGTGEPQQSLLREVAMAGVLLVTTPQDLSLLDTGRSLGLFRQAGVPVLGVVENMSYLRCPHCGEEIQVFHRGGQRLKAEVLGRVPLEPAISRGIEEGSPLAQAAVFRELAARISAKTGRP